MEMENRWRSFFHKLLFEKVREQMVLPCFKGIEKAISSEDWKLNSTKDGATT